MIKAWIFKPMTDPFRVDGLINAMETFGYPPGEKLKTYPTYITGRLGKIIDSKVPKTGWDMLVPQEGIV